MFSVLAFDTITFCQDCKEFQGELFGICNLFRDLSDNLFTSEIIESHEEQGQQQERHHCTNQGFKGLETHIVSSKDANTLLSTGSKTKKSSDPEMARTSKPLLEDMGKFNLCVFTVVKILYLD